MPVWSGFATTEQRSMLWLLVALLALIAIAAFAPPTLRFAPDIYLPLHTAMEVVAIVVAWLVFSVGWNAHDRQHTATASTLGCAFLCVAVIDLGHILSFAGMPRFVTPASAEKAIFFSLTTRMLAAVALLWFAFSSWRAWTHAASRYWLLGASIAFCVLIYWIGLFHVERLPRTFVPGQGLTPFKIGLEYLLIGMHLAAAVGFFRRLQREPQSNWLYMFAASCVMGGSQVFNTFYSDPYDIHNFLSHVYRVIAYVLIFRGIFITAISEPYQVTNRLRGELHDSAERLREMSTRIRQDIEEERKRISRSLHDDMGQCLTVIRMDLDWLRTHCDALPKVAQVTQRLQDNIESTAQSMRRVIADLRPLMLDDLGIGAAAKVLVRDFGERTGVHADFVVQGDFDSVPDTHQTAVFRMLQEALTNVARHANASRVEVQLHRDGHGIALTISDNGRGLAPGARAKRGSYGLFGMTEWATQLKGEVQVRGAPGQGTQVAVKLPIDCAAALAPRGELP